jgi:hypothetical protein
MSFLAVHRPDLCARLLSHPAIMVANEDLGTDPETGTPAVNCQTYPTTDPDHLSHNCEWITTAVCTYADEAEKRGGVTVIDRIPYLVSDAMTVRCFPFVDLGGKEREAFLLGLVHWRNAQRDAIPPAPPVEMVRYA